MGPKGEGGVRKNIFQGSLVGFIVQILSGTLMDCTLTCRLVQYVVGESEG